MVPTIPNMVVGSVVVGGGFHIQGCVAHRKTKNKLQQYNKKVVCKTIREINKGKRKRVEGTKPTAAANLRIKLMLGRRPTKDMTTAMTKHGQRSFM